MATAKSKTLENVSKKSSISNSKTVMTKMPSGLVLGQSQSSDTSRLSKLSKPKESRIVNITLSKVTNTKTQIVTSKPITKSRVITSTKSLGKENGLGKSQIRRDPLQLDSSNAVKKKPGIDKTFTNVSNLKSTTCNPVNLEEYFRQLTLAKLKQSWLKMTHEQEIENFNKSIEIATHEKKELEHDVEQAIRKNDLITDIEALNEISSPQSIYLLNIISKYSKILFELDDILLGCKGPIDLSIPLREMRIHTLFDKVETCLNQLVNIMDGAEWKELRVRQAHIQAMRLKDLFTRLKDQIKELIRLAKLEQKQVDVTIEVMSREHSKKIAETLTDVTVESTKKYSVSPEEIHKSRKLALRLGEKDNISRNLSLKVKTDTSKMKSLQGDLPHGKNISQTFHKNTPISKTVKSQIDQYPRKISYDLLSNENLFTPSPVGYNDKKVSRLGSMYEKTRN